MKTLRKIGMGIVGAILFATGANGATVDFDYGGGTIFSVTCAACASGDILGYQTALEGGDAYTVGGSFELVGTAFNPVTGNPALINPELTGEQDEIDFVSAITGESFTSLTKTATIPASVTGEYILFKSGQYAGVLQNLTGGALVLSYTGSQSAGLSHVSQFGEVSPVPIPAGAVLLLTGLGGLAMARRKRNV